MSPFAATLARALESALGPLVLFGSALVLRAVVAAFAADVLPGVQIWEYGLQGLCAAETAGDLCLRDGAGYPYASALMPPLTSYLWLGLFRVFGISAAAHVAYVALNVLVGAACAPLLYRLAREIGMERAPAFLAGALIAGYPTFVFVSAGYHATNVTIALMLGFAILFLRAAKGFDWKTALAAGLVGGFAALTRNELLVVAAVATLLLLWTGRRQLAAAAPAAAAMAVGVGLVLSPWIGRNYLVFDRFIPMGAQAGYNMWIGFGPYARGSGNSLDNDPEARAAAAAVRASVAPGDLPKDRFEPRQQRAFFEDAKQTLEHGGLERILTLTAEKFALLWLFDWTDPITHYVAYWAPWLLVHALALFGLFAIWRGRAPPVSVAGAALVILFLSVLTIAYSISSVFARYRMHMEPFVFLFAAIGAWAILSGWIHRERAVGIERGQVE